MTPSDIVEAIRDRLVEILQAAYAGEGQRTYDGLIRLIDGYRTGNDADGDDPTNFPFRLAESSELLVEIIPIVVPRGTAARWLAFVIEVSHGDQKIFAQVDAASSAEHSSWQVERAIPMLLPNGPCDELVAAVLALDPNGLTFKTPADSQS